MALFRRSNEEVPEVLLESLKLITIPVCLGTILTTAHAHLQQYIERVQGEIERQPILETTAVNNVERAKAELRSAKGHHEISNEKHNKFKAQLEKNKAEMDEIKKELKAHPAKVGCSKVW